MVSRQIPDGTIPLKLKSYVPKIANRIEALIPTCEIDRFLSVYVFLPFGTSIPIGICVRIQYPILSRGYQWLPTAGRLHFRTHPDIILCMYVNK